MMISSVSNTTRDDLLTAHQLSRFTGMMYSFEAVASQYLTAVLHSEQILILPLANPELPPMNPAFYDPEV